MVPTAVAPRRAARDVVIDSLRGAIAWSDALEELLRRSRSELSLEQAPDGPVLLLSPHLDDAVLSCWSVLTGPAAVDVVNVFSGIPPDGILAPPDRITGAQNSSTQMKLRIDEDRQALALADREPRNLMFLEVGYRRRAPSVRGLLDANTSISTLTGLRFSLALRLSTRKRHEESENSMIAR